MSIFDRIDGEIEFTGPRLLVPLWRLDGWWVNRWVGHDCDRQPVTCRLERWSQGFTPERWVRWAGDSDLAEPPVARDDHDEAAEPDYERANGPTSVAYPEGNEGSTGGSARPCCSDPGDCGEDCQ